MFTLECDLFSLLSLFEVLLLLFGKFYSFEIFSIGNSARTREGGGGRSMGVEELYRPRMDFVYLQLFAVKEYLTHIVGV